VVVPDVQAVRRGLKEVVIRRNANEVSIKDNALSIGRISGMMVRRLPCRQFAPIAKTSPCFATLRERAPASLRRAVYNPAMNATHIAEQIVALVPMEEFEAFARAIDSPRRAAPSLPL
jgi:hypothetical protein